MIRIEQGRLIDGLWLVVIARPASAEAPYSALRDDLLRLAERASLLAP